MYAILFRTLILYVLITVLIRVMGKRQVGELEMSELVTTLLLSQLASLPIEDPEISLSHVFIPILLIVASEIVITFLKGRINILKRVFDSRPSVLIDRGNINQAELLRVRLTVEELLSAVRQQGYRDIGDIYYAILEENGQFSLLPRTDCEPPTARDLGRSCKETGCAFALIADGVIKRDTLRRMGKTEEWLSAVCKSHGAEVKEVFLMTLDDEGKVSITKKEKGK